MKWLIASDIHGSAHYCEKLVALFSSSGAERLLLLGDILYHGPRNDLPKGYAPKQVIAMLNPLRERITCVRGNCDAEVDQMVLEFPIMSDSFTFKAGEKTVFATHGHVYNPEKAPDIKEKFVLLCGHTHVPCAKEHQGFTYINPGSVSIPKENSRHGAILLEDGRFSFLTLYGEKYDEYVI